MAALVTVLRHAASSTAPQGGNVGAVLAETTLFRRAGDSAVLVSARVASGSLACRVNGGAQVPLVAGAGDLHEAELDVSGLAEGAAIVVEVLGASLGAAMDLLEIHLRRVEVR